jgi:hypothetical protein
MISEGNRQAYPCRMFAAGEAPVARRTTGDTTLRVVDPRRGRPVPRERIEKSWEGTVLPHQSDLSCPWAGEHGGRRTGRTMEAGGVHGLRPPMMRRLQAVVEMCGEMERRKRGGGCAVVEEETEAKQTLKPLSPPTIISADFQLHP